MENKKDLGKIFKERLDEAEVTPNDELWAAISETLDRRSKKRRAFWLWSGLALLLLVLGVSYTVFNSPIIERPNKKENKRPFTKIDSGVQKDFNKSSDFIIYEKNNNKESKLLDTEPKKEVAKQPSSEVDDLVSRKASNPKVNKEINKTSVGTSQTSNQDYIKKKQRVTSNFNETKDASTPKKTANETNKPSPQTSKATMPLRVKSDNDDEPVLNRNTNNSKRTDTEIDTLENLMKSDSLLTKKKLNKNPRKITEEEKAKLPKPKPNTTKWLVSVQAGPNFYSFLSKGTPFENSLSEGKATGSISYSYGALLNIPLSEKTTFRLGYRRSNFTFLVKNARSNIADTGIGEVFTSPAISRNKIPIPTSISTTVNAEQSFTLKQKMNYNELPLEVYYNIYESELKVYAVGGISAMIMKKSSVTLKTMDDSIELGSVNFLKRSAFTLNVGLGLRYKVSDKVSFDLEPKLYYQFGTFEKSFENFYPIILVIHAGATFKL